MNQLFESDIKFDVCMLSYNLISSSEIENNSFLHKVLDAHTSSGYIICEHYYDTLISILESSTLMLERTNEHWNYAIDMIWKLLQKKDNWICFYPRIGYQRASYSDIGCEFRDYGI